ncbi:MAG: succinate dehydrogenase, cytochrome b556 subunit [Thiobacillaceae bacterium]|jgi:succinate dehydrogenase / fumarate reductase cytochrome b subunit
MYKRPVYLDLFELHLPLMGWVSILHRVTGILLFLALPLGLYALQYSLSSPSGFEATVAILRHPVGRALLLIVIVSLAHHVFAGLRHLAMDMHCGVEKDLAQRSARLVLASSLLAAMAAGWRLFT